MIVVAKPHSDYLTAEILLPASKSESNRLLIIQSLCKEKIELSNVSDAEDTKVLQHALKNLNEKTFDIGHAGTAMRFLTALFAITPGQRVLSGSSRMKERPIKILVDALIELGANISYTEKEGFPPLRIAGKELKGKELNINAAISSQYLSALLMIAPYIKGGLSFSLNNKAVSEPYIDMTIALTQKFGAQTNKEGNKIEIAEAPYKGGNHHIESDWSSASYWYEIAALSQECKIHLKGLHPNSLQADAACVEVFGKLGVESTFTKDGLTLTKKAIEIKELNLDCVRFPDMVQTLAATTVGLGIRARLSGLSTLVIKETNRLLALKNELEKVGAVVNIIDNNSLHIETAYIKQPVSTFDTYHDHRMALALSPLAMRLGEVRIENPSVVQKSYPNYWEDMRKAGFLLT